MIFSPASAVCADITALSTRGRSSQVCAKDGVRQEVRPALAGAVPELRREAHAGSREMSMQQIGRTDRPLLLSHESTVQEEPLIFFLLPQPTGNACLTGTRATSTIAPALRRVRSQMHRAKQIGVYSDRLICATSTRSTTPAIKKSGAATALPHARQSAAHVIRLLYLFSFLSSIFFRIRFFFLYFLPIAVYRHSRVSVFLSKYFLCSYEIVHVHPFTPAFAEHAATPSSPYMSISADV